jgi:hypothetical protein
LPRSKLTDVIGNRGESIFELAITEYENRSSPLFRPAFVGEKWPAVDYYVELHGARGVFFAQVKATAEPLGVNSISVRLKREKRDALARLPDPTYLVGVHEPSRRCFIRSIDRSSRTGVTSILLANELNAANLQTLFDEIKAFWAAGTYKPNQSAFS